MPNTSLQLNQLFSDPALLGANKGGVNFAGLLGMPGQNGTVDAFESLLSGLLKNGKVNANASVLLGAQTATDTTATPVKSSDVTLDDLLKGLPPELAALLKAQMVAQTNGVVLDKAIEGQSVLDALSVTPSTDGKKPELFAVIDDPELASILAGLSAQINALKANASVSTPIQGSLQSSVLSATLIDAAEKIKATLTGIQNGTIDIASLDMEGFDRLRKIAFADIAPWLTQPRTVVIDGRHIAKISQGPSFLNDGSDTDIITMSLNASALAAVLQQQQVVDPALQIGTATAPATPQVLAADTPKNPLLGALMAQQFVKPASNSTATSSEGFVATGQASTDAAFANTTPTGAVLPQTAASKVMSATAMTAGLPADTHTVSNSTSRGFGDVLSDFAQEAGDPFQLNADSDLGGLLKPQTEGSTVNATSTLLTARAGHPHPSMHLVSVALQRNLNPHTPGTEREFSINMEPGSLGRVRVTLQFGEDNKVKAKLIAERPETLAMLQKDVASLDRLLSDNGFDTSSTDTFSFDLGNSDSFSQAMNDPSDQQQGKKNGNSGDVPEFGIDDALLQNVVPVFVDPVSGLTHVNITI